MGGTGEEREAQFNRTELKQMSEVDDGRGIEGMEKGRKTTEG